MIALIVVVFHVLGVMSSIHAIMNTRTEQGTIAWAVSLNTFRYIAVPAYWILERSRFEGYVKARRSNMKVAWIGGHNVGDEYLSRDRKIGPWRDTHVRVEGPAALSAQLVFAEDWHWATGGRLDVRWEPVPSNAGNVPVLIVPSSPADTLETANLMYIHAISSAKERIWIASPYFVPDKPVTDALQLAGLRGVDVRILIPDKPDNPLVGLAAYSYLDDASRTGAKCYRYGAGFLHEKVMLIDRSAATVDTANFDNRSFRLNFEITALVSDAAFAEEVERMFEADFARSRVMGRGEYDRKPWWFRLGVRLARLTGPVQ